uniref:Peptidase M20 dimerisation domain-containing protein n=1 Tax=Helicotheca tamesis TaxID=374047 RepID=A0A7S2IGE9_9STRA|eukprot:CAMPEP_0185727834 /NCGR_PEP_ID=MMETSP1171-20130828/3407_1 /TAXON_ID=374046 /ORGANISM="Helicotheca tamensis, Strain CCMP826" /LENGTH=519 /DNA_ID=CAMNT_0028396471 /DNA_START=108 /DNA_END=1667 /DNA_ORIENTATION=-
MRLIVCFAYALLLLQPCASLPFGSRAKTGGEDQKEEEKQAENNQNEEVPSSSVRGAASKISNSNLEEFAISPTVEAFFEGPFDSELSNSLKEAIRKSSNTKEMGEFLQATRRSLHRKPELMYELPFTSNTIQTILDELSIPYTSGWAKNTHQDVYPGPGGYGIVAHIGTGSEDQPCIILRADMDALPIKEATEGIGSFKSSNPGKMHACGHDGHVTMLLGAAALLKKIENQIEGTIRLVFQPAEEGGAGMKRMVEEGIVELQPKAQYAFAMHVWPALPTGTIASAPGPLLAAADTFEITIHGKGGHAAMPHLTIDPIVTASSLVMNLQSIVSRTISPLESGVVSVTQFSAGDAFNVIPASAIIKGTIRALSTEMLISLREKVTHMVDATATMHRCNSTIQFSPDYYPPTVNDAELFDWSKTVGEIVSREGKMRDIEPTMGGEDFAFLAQTIPSTFFLVGQGSGGDERYHLPRTDYGLHHPSFALDEEVLPIGVELHANVALRSLKKLSQDSDETTMSEL